MKPAKYGDAFVRRSDESPPKAAEEKKILLLIHPSLFRDMAAVHTPATPRGGRRLLRQAMVLACLGAAHAFSPAPVLRTPQPARTARLAAAPAGGAPVMLLSPFKVLLSIPTLYALMSVNEYCTHRWYQHEEFNRDHKFNRFWQNILYQLKRRPLWIGERRNVVKIKGGGHVEHHAEERALKRRRVSA